MMPSWKRRTRFHHHTSIGPKKEAMGKMGSWLCWTFGPPFHHYSCGGSIVCQFIALPLMITNRKYAFLPCAALDFITKVIPHSNDWIVASISLAHVINPKIDLITMHRGNSIFKRSLKNKASFSCINFFSLLQNDVHRNAQVLETKRQITIWPYLICDPDNEKNLTMEYGFTLTRMCGCALLV